jgi:hemolysin III
MNRQDIAAAKAVRKSTLKSLKAKRESRIKSIQERAAEEIRQVNIQFAADPERMRAKYAADAAYKSDKARRSAEKAQQRAEVRASREAKELAVPREFSFGEEIFNSITLGIGAGLSIAAIILLVIRAAVYAPPELYGRTVTSFALTGTFLFLVYLMSTLAHALTPYGAKRVFRVLSYDCGYLCYASILSLFALGPLHGPAGWILFGINWFMAALAVLFYSVLDRSRAQVMKFINAFLALALAAELKLLIAAVPVLSMKLLTVALVSFLIGELFHMMKKVKWANSIFHIFNLSANIFVFFGLFLSLPPAAV